MSSSVHVALFLSAASLAGDPARTVEGVARDAKGRALLEADDGELWTVRGVDAWPAGLSGQRVAVRGVPGVAQVLPAARRDADGGWSQGVAPGGAPDRVLGDAAWTRLPPLAGPWSVVVRSGDDAWRVGRDGAGMAFTGPGGVGGVVEPLGAARLFAAVGRAQAAAGATARTAETLEIQTAGAAGEAGALLPPGAAADAVRAALLGLGDLR